MLLGRLQEKMTGKGERGSRDLILVKQGKGNMAARKPRRAHSRKRQKSKNPASSWGIKKTDSLAGCSPE